MPLGNHILLNRAWYEIRYGISIGSELSVKQPLRHQFLSHDTFVISMLNSLFAIILFLSNFAKFFIRTLPIILNLDYYWLLGIMKLVSG